MVAHVRSLRPELPRDVYVLQSGLVLNAFGNGAANPFMVIYLHDVRGIPLGLAGLVASTNAACGLVAALASGSLADGRGARTVMLGGLALSAVGFGLYPLVREAWQALALAVLLGLGGGTWLTMQAALLAAITPSDRRPAAFAQQRVAANLGLGLGGYVGGSIVSSSSPSSFTVLFELNAATFLLYGAFLLRLHSAPRGAPRVPGGGYRAVLRDRTFARVLALNFAFVFGTIALVNSVFPVFAKNQAGVDERTIGFLFLVNSLLIIVLQLPIARITQGRRRLRSLALMAVLFACCWTLVALAGTSLPGTVVLLVTAFAVLSVGECIYDSVYGPLVPDLAPAHLTGRYMAASGLSWQLGFIAGPVVGATLLGAYPDALWPAVALFCLGAAVAALRLERTLG